MLFAENRPDIYFSFDTNYGITPHGSVGIVEDDIVSKATFIAPHSLVLLFRLMNNCCLTILTEYTQVSKSSISITFIELYCKYFQYCREVTYSGQTVTVRGLLVAVGRCNTQARLSLIYVPGQPPRPPVPGIL